MLKLDNIVKDYASGGDTVHALKGVSLEFGKSEFVSILGQSGCGKTTLLNIIGGLDSYTSGDLIIDGISTKKYKDRDWDAYRNHRIGFVFQSYNLIPHQSILANVEIALTLSGVSKKERRKRAVEALKNVGLGDQIHKKPNQLSGGQMQRVAIARALVNNPDILLADEPTGALDSETSVQIMELLKEISQNKLIIMVTHNPELAKQYSTRIIKLFDGNITDDSNPYVSEQSEEKTDLQKNPKKVKKPSMSRFTALSLSFNNLLTKKARTFLTAFAGSIGIIGIALILSLSNGIQLYIDKVETETLSSYPITVEKTTLDMSGLVSSFANGQDEKEERTLDRIYSNNIMTNMMDTMISGVSTNNLKDFKAYLDSDESGIKNYSTDVQYYYETVMNIYKADTSKGVYKVNPNGVLSSFRPEGSERNDNQMMSQYSNTSVFTRLLDNKDVLNAQYETIAGRMPESYDEVVLIVSKNNEITDYTLYALGIKDVKEVEQMMNDAIAGKEVTATDETEYSYDEMLNLNYKLLLNTDYFVKEGGNWVDKSKDDIYISGKLENAINLKVVGIVRPNGDAATASGGMIGFRTDLMEKLIDEVNASEIVTEQKNNPDTDIFTGLEFAKDDETFTIEQVNDYIASLPEAEQMQYGAYIQQMRAQGMDDDAITEIFASNMKAQKSDATFDGNLEKLGVSDLSNPASIYIYPKDFEAKDGIADIIETYNEDKNEADRISYTDYIGLILSSVTDIINAISYILIAFVAISLIVSSIMIGVITYISVLERTKEIGILRAMGASKRDISRVFNAETLIVGFISGAIGIGASLLLIIPINMIIHSLTEISASAQLPVMAGVILVLISMCLTFIAGLIPSRVAAKKDPVIALRTE